MGKRKKNYSLNIRVHLNNKLSKEAGNKVNYISPKPNFSVCNKEKI